MADVQRTLSIIKPDAAARPGVAGQILQRIEESLPDALDMITMCMTGGLPLHVAGKLRPDSWTGPDAVQLFIEDAAAVQG